MFALICCDLDINKTLTMYVILKNIQNYDNVFDLKNAFIFLKYIEKNYEINLLLKKKLSYNLIYILFKQKLIILRNYLLKNLTLNKIRKLIS